MNTTTDQETERRVISSGNIELDSKMGGGLPAGSLALIEGSSGSGKSVLSQQILRGALQDGFRTAVFTSENSVKSMIRQMQSIDLDIYEYLLLRKVRVYPMALSRLEENAIAALLRAMKQEHERDLVVVDSFTSALSQETDEWQILNFFEECKALCADGTTIMITLHSQAVDDDLMGPIRSMCDANLTLKAAQDGNRLVKTLEVAKIRGAASGTGAIVGFDVEPGWGMRVIPISKARG
jgi:flagellar protein FlaH